MTNLKLRDPANWMSDIGDDIYLDTVNIPGTHDSAAINTLVHTPYACHYKTLTEQMNEGIRFFDIRIKVKGKQPNGDYKFVTCHGDFGDNEYQSLRSALDEFKNFLNTHLRETLILSVKIDDWNGYENDKINVLPGLHWWFGTWFQTIKFDTKPQMRDVRGKVCLFNRVGGYESGFGPKAVWKNATPFEETTIGSTRFIVQDKYEDLSFFNPEQEKCDLVFGLMEQHKFNGIALNFASAITDILTGVYIAPLFLNKLGQTSRRGRISDFGWILFDYEDSRFNTSNYGEITVIDLILDSNFSYENFQNKFEILTSRTDI
jgi:hypothetical protein